MARIIKESYSVSYWSSKQKKHISLGADKILDAARNAGLSARVKSIEDMLKYGIKYSNQDFDILGGTLSDLQRAGKSLYEGTLVRPMTTAQLLLRAIKTRNLAEAHDLFGKVMARKVKRALQEEKESLVSDADKDKEEVQSEAAENKCELCGSKKNVKRVDDTWLCAGCDVEED